MDSKAGSAQADPRIVIARLIEIVGADSVLSSVEERVFYSTDFSEQPPELPIAVVQPKSAEDIAAIVRVAAQSGVVVNTRGGGMSYTRGHCPIRPETIIVDARGLNRVLEINTVDRYVTTETGVTWAELRAALAGSGFRVPYLGTLSGNIATIGGGLSQNATGMGRVTLAEHVLALEVVLGDGQILRTGSWAGKDTAPFYRYFGPDLTGMFLCDSGAFGIKTKVTLQLEPWPKMAFGCFAFDNRLDLVATQAAFAQTGLPTDCFAFDGYFVNEFAKSPPPPPEDKRRMVRQYLGDHPNKLRALRGLLRAWHPKGLGFLKGLPNAMYFVTEAHDQAAADRMMASLYRIARSHNGRALPTAIPFGLRYGPFVNVGEIIVTPKGEVNFPINAKFPASKAVEAMQAFLDFVAENEAVLREHEIRVACNSLLHGHFWGIEPVLFWRRPLSPYRAHYAPAERRNLVPEDEGGRAEATAAAIDFRYRLTKRFRSLGSLHVQWAKSYPFAEALEGGTAWSLLGKIKRAADPDYVINPGLLGLGPTNE